MESRECGKFSLVSLQYKTAKYLSVFRITLQNHFAYIADFLTRTVFLLVILFIFTQLWETTFSVSGKEIIAGYTLQKLLWYLVFTEAIVMAMPRLIDKVETEVKQGDIAYFLNRPLSYIGYHYCGYLAEALIRVTINLWVGGLLIYILYDGIEWTWVTVPTTLLLIISALTLQFLIIMGLSLSSFWIEEVRGYELVYSKMVMILGGMMVPLDIFPEWLARIAKMLPFQSIVYAPATFAVNTAGKSFWAVLGNQWLWILLFGAITVFIYKKGVTRLNVNGG